MLSLFGINIPIYVSDRCNPYKSFGKVHDWLRKKLYKKAKGIIAQTEAAKKIYAKQFFHSNVKVIPNPVRKITIDPQTNRENIVLSVGRLIETKHHDRLIRLFAKIDKKDWKLIIVGGDAIKQNNFVKLDKLIVELKMSDRVLLTGTVADVEYYYSKSKIFAFTSSSEGFPNVIGEALSAGLPVVSYNCIAGPSDLIEHGVNGYLVDVFDDEKFLFYLTSLMEMKNKWLEVSKNARDSIEKFKREYVSLDYQKFIINH